MSFHARWGPDPNTIYLDVFSIPWETKFFYALPPFSLIAHCLYKIARAEHIRAHNDCSLQPIQQYTAGAPDSRCAKDISTATDHDHAHNTRKMA